MKGLLRVTVAYERQDSSAELCNFNVTRSLMKEAKAHQVLQSRAAGRRWPSVPIDLLQKHGVICV